MTEPGELPPLAESHTLGDDPLPDVIARLADGGVADLAIASSSLDWNFGEGYQEDLFDAYGVEPDDERIRYHRELWHLES